MSLNVKEEPPGTYPGGGGMGEALFPAPGTWNLTPISALYCAAGRVPLYAPITMASSGSWPNPDVLSQCFTVVRWFHEQGNSWSGPAPELASQLTSYCDTGRWFSNSDQLVSFLETNVV